jgi:hypothetical protein
MKSAINLDEIVRRLENNKSKIRIKKLMVCACYKCWETDLTTLDKMSFYDLISDLKNLAPTLGQLSSVFIKIVDRINKKYIYFSIATQLLRVLKDLYPLSTLNAIHNKVKVADDKLKYIPALFDCKFLIDLKFKISRYTSLSRSRILVFSALNYEFQYSTKDWDMLNHQDFDELVRNFFYDCGTIEEVKFRLYGAANYLEDREKNIEIANIILESTYHFYTYLQQRHDREIENTIRGKDITQFEEGRTALTQESTTSYGDRNPQKPYPLSYPSILITNLLNATSSDRFHEIVNSEKITRDSETDTRIKKSIQERVDRIVSIIEDNVRELEIELNLDLISIREEEYTRAKNKAINIFLQRIKVDYLKYLKKSK